MRVKINKKEIISQGAMRVEFGVIEGTIEFMAGQFFTLRLPKLTAQDGRGNSRFFGFANKPSENNKIVTVSRIGTSDFKKYLWSADVGEEQEVTDIKGEMTLPADVSIPIVIITGGIGIVPYISMLSEIEEKKLNYDITMLYSNTNLGTAVYFEKLKEWANNLPGFKLYLNMTQDQDWAGTKGRIDENMLRSIVTDIEGRLFLVTGTPRFVPDMVKLLNGLGVKPENRKFEIFTGY